MFVVLFAARQTPVLLCEVRFSAGDTLALNSLHIFACKHWPAFHEVPAVAILEVCLATALDFACTLVITEIDSVLVSYVPKFRHAETR